MNTSTMPSADEKTTPPERSLISFCDESTAHGLGHLAKRHTFKERVIWLCIFTCTLGLCSLHLGKRVEGYLTYKYQEVLSSKYEPDVPFPDVTICNEYAVSRSKHDLLDSLTSKYFYLPMTNPACKASFSAINFPETASSLSRLIGPSNVVAVSHNLSDLVQSCSYASTRCQSEDFTPHYDPDYFTCYTLNVTRLVERHLAQTGTHAVPGVNDGLSLILFLENTNGSPTPRNIPLRPYDGFLYPLSSKTSGASGARLALRVPGREPVTAGSAVLEVSAGFSTSIVMKPTISTRLKSPYRSNCSEATEVPGTLLPYSQDSCVRVCQQRMVIDSCHCSSSLLPSFSGLEQVPICGMNICNYTDLWCALNNSRLVEDACVRNCPRPCEEYSYTFSVSDAYWPAEEYQESFYLGLPYFNELVRETLGANASRAHLGDMVRSGLIRANFLRANIFFEDYIIDVSEEVPLYDIYALLTDFGGTFGLWAGMSVITFIEVIEFVLLGALPKHLRQKADLKKTRVAAAKEASIDSTLP